MKEVGPRELRRRFSALLEVVENGGAVTVTDRGRPVARLVPAVASGGKAFPDLSRFRSEMPILTPALSQTLAEDRADRF